MLPLSLSLRAELNVLSYRALHMFRTIVLLPRLAGIQPLLMCQKTLQCLELLLTRRVTGEGERRTLAQQRCVLHVPFQ